METKDIITLCKELEALKDKVVLLEGQVARLTEMGNFDRKNMLKFVIDRVRELDEFIFPVFHKVFPDYAASSRQIDAIIKWRPTGHEQGQTGDGKEII